MKAFAAPTPDALRLPAAKEAYMLSLWRLTKLNKTETNHHDTRLKYLVCIFTCTIFGYRQGR